MTCNSLFYSSLTDQDIQYLLAPLVPLFICLFVGVFFRLSSFHLGLFCACLGPKFNLSRDESIFLLNLSYHMAPVCNFPVGGTASFNNLLQVLQLSLHQRYKDF